MGRGKRLPTRTAVTSTPPLGSLCILPGSRVAPYRALSPVVLLVVDWPSLGATPHSALTRPARHAYFFAAAGTGFAGAGGSGGLVHTGSLTSFEAAIAVGFSDAWPQAVSSGSLAKSTMQPSRLKQL
jgi:hypothetical protein